MLKEAQGNPAGIQTKTNKMLRKLQTYKNRIHLVLLVNLTTGTPHTISSTPTEEQQIPKENYKIHINKTKES